MLARIFLSYARDDADAAKQLAACLSDGGHEVWWDQPPLHGRLAFAAEIDKALKDAEAVVVMWSPTRSIPRGFRMKRRRDAIAARLVPVSLAGAKPPLGFRQFQTIELGRWDGTGRPEAIDDLLEAISRTVRNACNRRRRGRAKKAAEPQRRQSVCVLPFINMSGEPEQEYFSDGITEDIITDLSKVSALSIVARNTAFAFKGQAVDVKDSRAKRSESPTCSKEASAKPATACGSLRS